MSHPIAQAFYPPLSQRSDGQSSNNGLRELAASRWHSPQITLWLVVSYTTFSPLPSFRRAVVFFCHILLSPIASTFGSGASCAARTFLLPQRTSGRPERCFLTAKLINLNEKQRIQTFFLLCIGGLTVHNSTFLLTASTFFYVKDPSPPHWQTKTCKQAMVNIWKIDTKSSNKKAFF